MCPNASKGGLLVWPQVTLEIARMIDPGNKIRIYPCALNNCKGKGCLMEGISTAYPLFTLKKTNTWGFLDFVDG